MSDWSALQWLELALAAANVCLGAFLVYRFRRMRHRALFWLFFFGAFFVLRGIDRGLEIAGVHSEAVQVGVDLLLLLTLVVALVGAERLSRAFEHILLRSDLSHVVAYMPDGVVLLDQHDNVMLVNPAAESITGIRERDIRGTPMGDIVADWPRVRRYVPVNTAGDPRARRADTVPVHVGDRELWLSILAVRFAEGTVFCFRDQTREHHIERLRSEFVSTASHELRTPLASIYGAALTMKRPDLELDDEQRETLLDVIVERSEWLTKIVDDILTTSTIDAGRLRVQVDALDIAELVHDLVADARTRLPSGFTITEDVPAAMPIALVDADRLRQVLTNLVDNAIKYSPNGGTVHVAARVEGSTIQLSVADQGRGIPADEQQLVFEKFYRSNPQDTTIGGTGLGLYISKNIVQQMGGQLWVESTPGEGSRFVVELPTVDTAGIN